MSPRAARTALAMTTAAWLLAVLLISAFYFELYYLLVFLPIIISGPLIVVAIGISIAALLQLRSPFSRKVALEVLVLVVSVACFTSFTQFSTKLGMYVRLGRCERVYQDQIESIATGAAPRDLGSCGMAPAVDSGPPLRIAIPWVEVTENWMGIIYDPSRTIAGLEIRPKSGIPAMKIFDSSLEGATHVWGPWYYCWFNQGGIAGPDAGELFGSWRLVSDDDAYRQPIPSEVITFRRDGKVSIAVSGGPHFAGSYRVEGKEIVLTLVVQGSTRVNRLLFKLNKAGLHFANPLRGFAHYARVKS